VKYRIKNWAEFQHYKDRNPPWIKLHVGILSSQDWVTLDDKSRVLAIACMVLASKTGGEIDGSPAGLTYLRRAAYLNSKPDLKPLVECGFLEVLADASALQASASGSVYTEESRGEAETEQRITVPAVAVTPFASVECFALAERLRAGMLRNNPTVKTPPKLDAWAKTADQMLRLDKRTVQQIELVIDFSQWDDFWKTNELSMDEVRRQFDKLVLNMQSKGPMAARNAEAEARRKQEEHRAAVNAILE